jgi:hypothetical protein
MRAAGLTLLGVLLVALGLILSPWPWLAPVVPGAAFFALGVSVLMREETP